MTGEKVISCSADGLTATVVTDCGAQSEVCVSGSCAPVVCPAGKRFCDTSNNVRTCSAKGDSSTLYQSCGTADYCDSTSATCQPLVCTPNQPACSGQIATTCNSVGSGYVAGGVNCASSSQVCVQGACANLACTPSSYYCNLGNVYHCSTDGLSSTLYQTCTSTQYCDSSTATASCKTQVCTPGQPACNGTVATTCNSTGSGYTGTSMDCAASGLSCVAGVCTTATTTVDTADPTPTTGTATSSTAAVTKVDFFSATTSRTLRLIEMYFGTTTTPTTSATLTWVVYEATTQTGTYSLISSTNAAASSSTPQYFGSGALSVPLVAGRFYAIGVGWTAVTGYYYKPALASPTTTSFGTFLGGYTYASDVPSTVTFTNADVYAVRITTSP
jgi:hypothetical protein